MGVVAIVQARMGSSRFPGKVLEPLAGEPVLWHVVHRLRQSERIGSVVVATSTESADDAIESFCRELDVPVVRGPEENVLERFRIAVERFRPDVVVRVTGDAPLVDPDLIDRMVGELEASSADRCTVNPDQTSIHEGFSVLTRDAFERLVREAGDDPVAREHVTGYFLKDRSFVTTATVDVPEGEQFEARLSVDTPADLRFLSTVYDELAAPPGELEVERVVTLLRRRPDLREINDNVGRKDLRTESPTVLIRCDGGTDYGWGHLTRSLAVAEPLRTAHGAEVHFAFRGDEAARETISDREFRLHRLAEDESEAEWMDDLVGDLGPDALVLDVRSDLSPGRVREWRRDGVLVASIDDITPRRLEADLVFYPPVPQVEEMDWSGHDGEVLVGWRWVVVDERFEPTYERSSSHPPTVLVTMGGSDPMSMTSTAIKAISQVGAELRLMVVIGASFQNHEELSGVIEQLNIEPDIHQNTNRMPELMDRADIGVASFGVTAYELAAMGVPSVHLCLTEDHAKSSRFFEEEGMAMCLGLNRLVKPHTVADAVQKILEHPGLRTDMRQACLERVDNHGGHRIAARIMSDLT